MPDDNTGGGFWGWLQWPLKIGLGIAPGGLMTALLVGIGGALGIKLHG
jgi:hypothetical protein